MQCVDCGKEIPAQRLAAMPRTRLCVPCLEGRGDVRRIRRYEDYDMEGNEVAAVMFLEDETLEDRLKRRWKAVPRPSGDEVLTNDSNLAVETAQRLTSAFEDEDDPGNAPGGFFPEAPAFVTTLAKIRLRNMVGVKGGKKHDARIAA
jgi:Prokaryotic dksA/traR C4-type zinc finger